MTRTREISTPTAFFSSTRRWGAFFVCVGVDFAARAGVVCFQVGRGGALEM